MLLSHTSKFHSPGTAVLPQRIATFKLPLTHKVGRNRGITYIDITKSYSGPVATLLQALSELEIPYWQVLRALPAALPTLLPPHISILETQMEAEEADSRKQTWLFVEPFLIRTLLTNNSLTEA